MTAAPCTPGATRSPSRRRRYAGPRVSGSYGSGRVIEKVTAVDDREDGCSRTDSQRQRQERDRREHGRASERAQPMDHVARHVVQPWHAALIPERVHRLRRASRLNPCGARRIVGGETTTSCVLCGQLQVRPKLAFQVGVTPARPQRSPETLNPFAKDAHVISLNSSGPRVFIRHTNGIPQRPLESQMNTTEVLPRHTGPSCT